MDPYVQRILEESERRLAATSVARPAEDQPDIMLQKIIAAHRKAERAHNLANGTVQLKTFTC